MDTRSITPETLAGSVIAVPPLARRDSLQIDPAQNQRIIRHLEAGGVRTLLYGGNAVLGHVLPSEYAGLLSMLRDSAGADTLVIPSVGPAFGLMMEQADVLRDFDFPTAMMLPTRDAATPAGLATGFRRFAERFGRPAVLYLKYDGALDVESIRGLFRDGLISCIKYAIVRAKPAEDPFLRSLIDAVGAQWIVSGMGEQPAIIHMRDFGLIGFTSGCVCIAPRMSMDMLRALQQQAYDRAEDIRERFAPLEALRDNINPVRVLHAAVALADIAETGPIMPLLSPLEPQPQQAVAAAARTLLAAERAE